ncbi:MAG TPA: SdiA-regulated domain-containing protein [Chitinophagaceae bacterium]|nr:SdiA-regulated domain-containing protein [Chitinophagaceae bacterium]
MRTLLSIILSATLASCGQSNGQEEKMISPAGYNLNTPVKILLSQSLKEISGIRIDEANKQFIAVNDEEGKFYRLGMDGTVQGKAFKFAKKGDFEDLDFDGTYWYAVKSTGEVHQIAGAFTDSSTTREFPFSETGIEFETICYDKVNQKIFLLTKTPKELKDGRIAAYFLDTTSGSFPYAPTHSPSLEAITKIRGKEKVEFKPTSAAIHPLTGELYIISVNDRLLVIMAGGEVKQVYKLDKAAFRQPEGICFSANGDMFISNEAQDATANILHFKYDASTTVSR